MYPAFRFIAAAFLVAPLASAQADAPGLLRKVIDNYTNLSRTTWYFETVEVTESSSALNTRTERRSRSVGSGLRYRLEWLPSGPLYISDGEFAWNYNPERNEYTREAAGSRVPPSVALPQLISIDPDSARTVRQEAVDLGGTTVLCQVLEAERRSSGSSLVYTPVTIWIDTSRMLVLREKHGYVTKRPGTADSTTSVTTSFVRLEMGKPVDLSLLRFTIPPDSVRVDRLTFGLKSPLTGKDSPEFNLTGLDGKLIPSASLRGRPTLIAFGMPTDDESLLFVEMIHRAMKDKGLVAIFVAGPGHSSDAPLYSFQMATDPNGATARKLGVDYRGMVLLDRYGKIAYSETSTRSSRDLLKALQAVGLW